MTSRIASEGPRLRQWQGEVNGTEVHVEKLTDDPLCLRISLGGEAGVGYYLNYRGGEDQIEHLLRTALRAWRHYRAS